MENKKVLVLNKEKFLNYIKESFSNINVSLFLLIDNLIEFLKKQNNHTLESYFLLNEKFYINKYILDLIELLNNSNIDISINELIINKILMQE